MGYAVVTHAVCLYSIDLYCLWIPWVFRYEISNMPIANYYLTK